MSRLNITNLNKKFGQVQVLNNFNLSFDSGKIYGLFGPNGIGKTTLLKTIAGISNYDSGSISINESNVDLLKNVSYFGSNVVYYKWMKVKDIISLTDELYTDFDRAKCELFLQVSEVDFNQKIKTMSKGQQEIIFLALTLCRNVEIYILDEPFGAIDINKQEYYVSNLLQLFDPNSIMIITTHYPQTFSNIFDEVIFINSEGSIYNSDYNELLESGSDITEKYNEVFL